MTTIAPETIRQLVEEVVRQVVSAPVANDGIFGDVNDAVAAADQAWRQYQMCSMRDRARFVQTIRDVALDEANLEYMASAAVEETGMGRVADKITKNRVAAELTPGIEDLTTEAWSGDEGLTTVEISPFGVIGAITPTTNPTETIINNSIGMLAAGNAVVFSPHPRAARLSQWLIGKL
ncbi:MAG: aldehyde dehydrogenase family protein, partial [Arachnia sp.]